jgi:hypothetical protein
MKLAGGALLGAGLIEGFQTLYEGAAESARITRLTEQVIKSTGGAAKLSAAQVGDLAGAISEKTGVDDEAIQSGANLLLTFTNIKDAAGAGNDIFSQTTQIMTDMSAALGTDASGSAIQLGKALNDPIRGVTSLTKVGVSFTEQQREQIKTLVESGDIMGAQRIILAELGREFGGAAEAAATPVDKLRVNVGNLAEQAGAYLIPAVNEVAEFILADLIPALREGASWVGEHFGGAFGLAVDGIQGLVAVGGTVVDIFQAIPGPVQAGVVALGAYLTLRGPVSAAFETVALKAMYLGDTISGLPGKVGGARGALSGLVGLLGGPWGIALTGATIGLGYLVSSLGDSDQVAEEAKAAQEGFAAALRDSKGAIDENVRAAAAKAAQDNGLLAAAERAGVSLSKVTDAITGQSGALVDVRGQLQQYVDQQTTVVVDANGQVTTSLSEEGRAALAAMDSLGGLSGQVGQTSAQQQQLASATQSSDTAMASAQTTADAFAAEMEDAQTQVDEAKRAVDQFKLSLDILTGANVSAIEVEAAFQEAIDSAKGAMEGLDGSVVNSAGSLDLNSEAGRKAADVLLDVRNSGNDLIATLIEQGATEDEVRKKDAELRGSFIDTAREMGISEEAAFGLADQILGIPAERETKIAADVGQARAAVATVQSDINNLKGREVFIDVAARTGRTVAQVEYLFNKQMWSGGYTGDGDKYAPMGIVHGGEYVFTKEQTRRLGKDRLEALANTGELPGYAEGGFVRLGSVSDAEWDRLLAAGWRGRAGDSMEALHAPASVKLTSNFDTLNTHLNSIAKMVGQAAANGGGIGSGVAGAGAVGGAWTSIWNYVKARIPQARINSTYRPGDPGYHGRNKAIDFGFGTGPGGAGSAGLASINRLLHDGVGRNLAELIYDGIGDDRPDLKNGRPLTYNAGTRAAHRNHVHAAVYDDGGWLQPGYTLAFNGTGEPERIRTADQEAALGRSGPLIHVENQYVRDAVDLDLVLQQASFRERMGSFG